MCIKIPPSFLPFPDNKEKKSAERDLSPIKKKTWPHTHILSIKHILYKKMENRR